MTYVKGVHKVLVKSVPKKNILKSFYVPDGRQQILSLGMDLQLEWMKLEDFQKHLDGEDENFSVTDAVSTSE